MQKTVLITGCSDGGIGHEFAVQFHSRGFKVIATARSLESVKSLKALGMETVELEVTDSNSIKKLKAQVEKITGGTLDVLINNAGVSYTAAGSDDDMEHVKALFAVNVFAVMEITQAFVPLLVASSKKQLASGYVHFVPRVVFMSSITGILPMPYHSAYNAGKAAIVQYGNTLRLELEPLGVRAITIHTGKVITKLVKEQDRPRLPEGSFYAPVKDVYEGLGHDIFALDAIPVGEFGKAAVTFLTKKNPGAFFWYGSATWLTWIVDTFFPRTMWDVLMGPMFSMKRLNAAFKQSAKA